MKWPSWWPFWWPWLPPSRGDVRAAIMGIGIVAILILIFLKSPVFQNGWGQAAGFGRDWICASIPFAGPVCVKDVKK